MKNPKNTKSKLTLDITHPELAAQWHPTKNGDLKPSDVTYGSHKEVYWHLPYDDPKTGKHFNFEWPEKIYIRTIHNYGCPFLSNRKVWKGFNDLATTHPDIAAQWHPTKNGDLTPCDVTYGSEKKAYFICPYCGNIFHQKIYVLISSATYSCGCINSKANMIINKYLQFINIDYNSEYSFVDLRLVDLLRFDFAIFKHNKLQFLLEYHGRQHYKDTDFGRQQREITDPMKLEYCKKNNIKLHIISYYEASTEEEIQARVREILVKENIISVSPIKDIIIRPAAVLSKPLSLTISKAS